MSIKAPGYNIEGSLGGGFVKNLADGTLTFDNAGSGGSGTGWELVERKVIASDVGSITFSGLDGDVDEQYMLIAHEIAPVSGGANYTITMRPNGATTLQHSFIISSPSSSGVRSPANFTDIRWRPVYFRAADIVVDSTIWITAKTGDIRVVRSYAGAVGVSVFPGGIGLEMSTARWQDTAANITSLDIVASVADGLGAGSTYCLYKKSAENTGRAAWELVEKKDIISATTSITFSGLDGDTDKQYMMLYRIRTPGAAFIVFTMRPNGITANQNTIIRTLSSSGSAATSVFSSLRIAAGGTSIVKQWNGVLYFDAQTGTTARQFVSETTLRLSNITMVFGGLRLDSYGGSWDDTTTNITSFDIVCDVANGIGIGSQFSLYKRS